MAHDSKIRIGDTVAAIEYCSRCFSYSISNDPRLAFHGISSEHLSKHPGLLLRPENRDAPQRPEDRAPLYDKFFDREYMHLGPMAVIGTHDDLCFAFDIDRLKQAYPDIKFIDFNVWEMLGFHEQPEKPTGFLRQRLYVDDYTYNPEKPVEILLPSLDLNLAELVLVNAKKTGVPKGVKKAIFSTHRLGEIVKSYYGKLDLDCDCHLPREEKQETEEDKIREQYLEADCEACNLDCTPCFFPESR